MKYVLVFVSSQIIKFGLTYFKIKKTLMHPHFKIMTVSVVITGVSFKIMFYNDCVSQPEATNTLTIGRISYQYTQYSSFDQPKNYPVKNKKKS